MTPFGLIAGLGLRSGMPAATNASTAPSVELPPGANLPEEAIQVTESQVELPAQIEGTFVPVGKVFEVGPAADSLGMLGNLYLPDGIVAKLKYEYDADELKSAGFVEEFAGFYYDRQEEKWMPVDKIEVDLASHTVTVSTSHFTPFVLTAVPAASGNVADPPACISADFPSGLGGSAGAVFTIVDTDFKYYQDRGYTIDRIGGAFDTLGFNGALAISVCNGNSSCGTFAQHKQFTGSNYIQFTAHTNIDLYLMYDTRGGANMFDTSKDAPWIAASGFVNTGAFVATSDAVGNYRVYKKSYNKGDLVTLDGNRKGVVVPGIDTNYWVVIKRQGVTAAEPAAKTCEAKPSLTPPLSVSDVRIAPGSNQMILGFQIPDDEDFAGVVIRRSTTAAPGRVGDGVEPTGVVISATGYRDTSLSPNTQYYYTIFALDKNGAYGPGVSVSAKTGPDSDGDGLSNAFENSYAYPSGQKTDPLVADTDADGISDGQEFINGTDPRLPDTQKPVITQFNLTSAATTNKPRTTFSLAGTDDQAITGWMVTQTETPPVSWATLWSVATPVGFAFNRAGNHKLYAWAKDAAGNVSGAVPELAVNLEGINAPTFLYVARGSTGGADRRIDVLKINSATGVLQSIYTETLPDSSSAATPSRSEKGSLVAHPNAKFLYHIGVDADSVIRQFSIRDDGSLQLVSTISLDPHFGPNEVWAGQQAVISPSGKVFFLSTMESMVGISELRTFTIDAAGGLTAAAYSPLGNLLNNMTPMQNGFLVADQIQTNLGVSSFSYLENGATTSVYTIGDFTNATVGDPLGRYVYYSHVRSGTVQTRTVDPNGTLSLSGQVYLGVLEGKPLASDPDGNFLYVGLKSGRAIRIYNSGNSYGAVKDITAGFGANGPLDMLVDSTGTLAFVRTGDQSGMNLLVYRMDPGDLTLLTNNPGAPIDGYWGWGDGKPVVVGSHDGNDPPVANAGVDRWVQVSESAALHGHNTFDPDAARCAADTTKYVAAWNFVSKPLASGLTDSDIIGANTLGSARFIPDVPGNYKLRLTFTDDPGSCQGTAKTRTALVTIKAGYKHIAPASYWDSVGPRPSPEAVWAEMLRLPVHFGVDTLWAFVHFRSEVLYADCLAVAGIAYGQCNTMAGRLPLPFSAALFATCTTGYALANASCAAQYLGRYSYTNICQSPIQPAIMAWQYCEQRDWVRDFPNSPYLALYSGVRGHFFLHLQTRDFIGGQWSWFDYSPPVSPPAINFPSVEWTPF